MTAFFILIALINLFDVICFYFAIKKKYPNVPKWAFWPLGGIFWWFRK